jgi:hypothetical protein
LHTAQQTTPKHTFTMYVNDFFLIFWVHFRP